MIDLNELEPFQVGGKIESLQLTGKRSFSVSKKNQIPLIELIIQDDDSKKHVINIPIAVETDFHLRLLENGLVNSYVKYDRRQSEFDDGMGPATVYTLTIITGSLKGEIYEFYAA